MGKGKNGRVGGGLYIFVSDRFQYCVNRWVGEAIKQ
jgi:hypothetical protein